MPPAHKFPHHHRIEYKMPAQKIDENNNINGSRNEWCLDHVPVDVDLEAFILLL
jgi:hypothetical protein